MRTRRASRVSAQVPAPETEPDWEQVGGANSDGEQPRILAAQAVGVAAASSMKMFDLAWYGEWEEGEDAPTRGKMCDFIDVTRCVPCSPSELFLLALTLPGRREPCGFYSQSH